MDVRWIHEVNVNHHPRQVRGFLFLRKKDAARYYASAN
jgi:hypothetical protein